MFIQLTQNTDKMPVLVHTKYIVDIIQYKNYTEINFKKRSILVQEKVDEIEKKIKE